MRVFDVRQFGAMGNGVADDTEPIQQAIDAAAQSAGPPDESGRGAVVFFPAGRFMIFDTLRITNQTGITLKGVGTQPSDTRPPSLNHVGPRVDLVWAPTSPPMDPVLILIEGCSGITISDLGLYGAAEKNTSPATTLVRIDRLLGKARMNTLRNLLFVDAQLGIEMGSVEAREVLLERIAFKKVMTCFETTEDDDVNYRWQYLGAEGCPTVMRLPKGGCVNVDTAHIRACGGEGADEWCFDFGNGGSNCRTSRLTCVRAERATGGPRTLHLLRAVGDHRIALDSLTEAQLPQEDPPPWMYLDGAAVTCHACSLLTKPAVQWEATGRHTTVRFRGAGVMECSPRASPKRLAHATRVRHGMCQSLLAVKDWPVVWRSQVCEGPRRDS